LPEQRASESLSIGVLLSEQAVGSASMKDTSALLCSIAGLSENVFSEFEIIWADRYRSDLLPFRSRHHGASCPLQIIARALQTLVLGRCHHVRKLLVEYHRIPYAREVSQMAAIARYKSARIDDLRGPVLLSSPMHSDQNSFSLKAPGLDPAICWQALHSRDRRFDGRFFAGVLTTRVYCRPICPVPLNKPENVVWFPSAAAAEAAGFRPCRRCRAHTSPGTPAWLGTSAVVSRALKLICDSGLEEDNVEALAAHVGIGSRHLRRLFVQHLGASPIKIARTHRVHFARNLIEDTGLPITKIAFYSGFRSIRQFNHAIRESFDSSPSELRRLRHGPGAGSSREDGITLHLSYRPPFAWPALVAFLRPRATPGVEVVQDNCYRRTIEVHDEPGLLEVMPDGDEPHLKVRLKLTKHEHLLHVIERVRRMFDLGADPLQIASHLARDPGLKPLLDRQPGLRVPGVWDGFELAVCAVLGEQSTARDPSRPISRLVRNFGRPVETSVKNLTHLFPRPEVLALADLSSVGIRGARAAALRALAHAVSKGEITFEAAKTLEETLSRLRAVGGIGDLEAHYIALRASGEPDAFPFTALGLRRSVGNGRSPASPTELLRMADSWRPWRAYAAMYLWAADMEESNHRRGAMTRPRHKPLDAANRRRLSRSVEMTRHRNG
jgi:AraC family transcriptional regulator, regulatory protein of adaptative response / DNA-3-methyladenine glycosylase II